jgi:hypothetical protein
MLTSNSKQRSEFLSMKLLQIGTKNVLAFPQMQTHMLDPPFSWCLTPWFGRLTVDFSHFLINSLGELVYKLK